MFHKKFKKIKNQKTFFPFILLFFRLFINQKYKHRHECWLVRGQDPSPSAGCPTLETHLIKIKKRQNQRNQIFPSGRYRLIIQGNHQCRQHHDWFKHDRLPDSVHQGRNHQQPPGPYDCLRYPVPNMPIARDSQQARWAKFQQTNSQNFGLQVVRVQQHG